MTKTDNVSDATMSASKTFSTERSCETNQVEVEKSIGFYERETGVYSAHSMIMKKDLSSGKRNQKKKYQ